jgi:2-keto-3-deoxy-L-rhamnonate aldolase
MLATLHKKHKNIVGVKLTCASVGKITRLAAEFPASEFAVFGGQSDFLIAGLAVGSAGTISGFGNVAPKTIRRIYDLYTQGKTDEALKLHRIAAHAEVIGKSGIANTKYGASLTSARSAGIEGAEAKLAPRRPYEALTDEQKKAVRGRIEETIKIEKSL